MLLLLAAPLSLVGPKLTGPRQTLLHGSVAPHPLLEPAVRGGEHVFMLLHVALEPAVRGGPPGVIGVRGGGGGTGGPISMTRSKLAPTLEPRLGEALVCWGTRGEPGVRGGPPTHGEAPLEAEREGEKPPRMSHSAS